MAQPTSLRIKPMSTLSSAHEPRLKSPKPRSRFSAYLALTKPRVIELLLITTVPVMFLAQRGVPNLSLALATLIGGALSAGSANAFNCIIDIDIDTIMKRTANRPLVTGEISKRQAQIFAWGIGLGSILWLGLLVNWLSALLALSAELFYVFGYTLLLKRRTPQNIVWGGAAGAVPVLIGWSAITNRVDLPAILLFLVIFLWTPPHYWPLSMRYKTDYAEAGVPMLPVVANSVNVSGQIVLYSWAMVASTLILIPFSGLGWVYTTVALISGAWFIVEAHILQSAAKRPGENNAMRLFHFSISYLTVLFLAIAIDPLLHFGF